MVYQLQLKPQHGAVYQDIARQNIHHDQKQLLPLVLPTHKALSLLRVTQDPLNNADEALEFAKQYGLPIAIKAAFGGGGREAAILRASILSPSFSIALGDGPTHFKPASITA
jgi:hypothetical protein